MLDFAHPCTRRWFETSFAAPTRAQTLGWPPIVGGDSTLLLAPTGSGKTLAAFLVGIDRLSFGPAPEKPGVRLLYVTPLKALGVDVERNLRAPLAGIQMVAQREGVAHRPVDVAIRSGDTPQRERQRMVRHPPDILITTPESLYLMLTSRAQKILSTVETLIVDEIHSMVPTKRGSHLMLSLERLESLREGKPLQRIGLSATQRPLDEVARFLGGLDDAGTPREVTIVDAGHEKKFDLEVQVPVEDMARLDVELPVRPGAEASTLAYGGTSDGPTSRAPGGDDARGDLDEDLFGPLDDVDEPQRVRSIWPAIHPRLVRLIRDHRSTMIFVNSRRLAERLSGAINELAGEELALAHHGSIAKEMRAAIEDRLKRGDLPAIIATSSLELGIDIGAVDLVVQIEAPLSVASGVQRIGRAGHQVGAVSKGIIFPKFRGDLLACATVTAQIEAGFVEATYYPRNPLDVLAQQIVATVVAREAAVEVDALYAEVKRAAPFASLPRRSFEGVLDMLSGRYPSEQFGELRPRLTWDRIAGTLTPRRGARMLAIANAGTIPDRGLYGVFLAGQDKPVRVGELDEEMVFESREGDVFLLGASSWRIEEITHDRVLVSPAPGVPGRMPFWHGDRPGRPAEMGRAMGKLTRELVKASDVDAEQRLVEAHHLDPGAARNLVLYLRDQQAATGKVPSDRTIVVERFLDEIGDWCVCVLTPFGSRVHAPWANAVAANLARERGMECDLMWADDGIVFRLPEVDEPPDVDAFLPDPEEVERLVTGRVGETALFAARFRENAGRALLLPRRRPGQRTPLWQQRRKSASLLNVASGFRDFPILLETYRECLKDVFDVPGLLQILQDVQARKVRVTSVETRQPSPFAGAILFNYVAAFMYEGDAPLAERRAHALSLDHAQLRELLGEPELRELLDAEAIEEVEARLQRRARELRHEDDLHDLLLVLGDLAEDDVAERGGGEWVEPLMKARRVVGARIGDEARLFAAEDVARYRDALGVVPPVGTPQSLLDPVPDALRQLVARFARTHGPFRAEDVARRFGLGVAPVLAELRTLVAEGRLVEGEMVPVSLMAKRGWRSGREYVDVEVLRQIKRRSLAKLRAEIEPVDQGALARFVVEWQGVGSERRGIDALGVVVEQLQGCALPASALESQILPARVGSYDARDLDALCAAGDVLWRGVQPLGQKDGRIALYLADHYGLLAPPVEPAEGELAGELRELFAARGALFFRDLVEATRRLPAEVFDALWDLVWAGELTNDTLAPLRALGGDTRRGRGRPSRLRARRGSRAGPPGSGGRCSLLPRSEVSETERLEATATQLLERYGVLTREAVRAEGHAFGSVYQVLKAMEEAGKLRRGYFVDGLGATQFALPGCEDRLRAQRDAGEQTLVRVLAATDPANPYGAALPWPSGSEDARPMRAAGAQVVLREGELIGFVGKTGERLSTFLPEGEPDRSRVGNDLAGALGRGEGRPRGKRGGGGVLLTRIDGEPAHESAITPYLEAAGFARAGKGMFRRLGEDRFRRR